MSKLHRTTLLPFLLALLAGGLLAASLALPLWHLRMEAPQYQDQEALKVAVYPHSLRGDLAEIRTLNQYIGVHIPEVLPQLEWLPVLVITAALLGVGVAGLRGRARRWAGGAVPVVLALALLGAVLQAQVQMYNIGHRRSKSELVGVQDFTPPFLGTTKIAQFTVTSGFGLGAYCIGAAILLQLAGALTGPEQGPGSWSADSAHSCGPDLNEDIRMAGANSKQG
jgi:hypothetical protein